MADKKNKQSSVIVNFIYRTFYEMLTIIIPLLTAPYVSRVLGAENIGIYSFTYSSAHYFMLLAMLGVKNYGNRSIAMIRDNFEERSKTFFNIYALQCVSSIIMCTLYVGYIIFIQKEYILIAFIQILYVLTAMIDISWFYAGMEEFKITVTLNSVVKVVNALLVFAFVKAPEDLWKYTLIMAGGLFLGYLTLFIPLKTRVKYVRPTIKEMLTHLKPNLILFIPVMAVGVFNIMDKVMLGFMSTTLQVGYYENAEKLMRVPFGVITALGTVMMPRMTNMIAQGERKNVQKIISYSMVLIMFLACGMTAGLAGIAKGFAPVFFGKEFEKSGMLLMYLAPTVLFLSWANVVRTQHLIPNHKDKEFIISTIVGAVLNLAVNTLLIPKFDALGAVVGTLVAECGVTCYQTYASRKELDFREYFKSIWGFLVAGIIMFLIVLRLGMIDMNEYARLGMQFLVGFVLYVLLSILWICCCKTETIKSIKGMLTDMLKK